MLKTTKLLGTLIFITLFITSCKNNEGVEKLTKERDSLLLVAEQKDSSITGFVTALGDIENNLLNIRAKETALTLRIKNNEELKGNVQDEINENIKAINDLMDKNAVKIGDLNARLKASNFRVKELSVVVEALSNTLYNKNQDLAALNKALTAKNKLIVELRNTAFALAHDSYNDGEIIKQQHTKLNTAYYIFANHQQLKDKKVITKEGKLSDLFIGEQLNTNVSQDFLKEINIEEKTLVPAGWRMETKTIKFYTAHPDNSYKLIKDKKGMITNIDIIDPENFWKISKFLVVEVD